jgi:hypothetical protein
MSKSIRWVLEPTSSVPLLRPRRAVARWLRTWAKAMASLSRRLGRTETLPEPESQSFEFFAEAGAPEGALFVNGVRVGSISGVTRL